jgi:hypothetical protein
MAIPSSGPLSLTDIQTEFGGTNPISLNEYYAGGGLVPAGTSGTYGAVPSSGAISIQNFYGTSALVVPTGLIVPLYNTTTVPSGWSAFTLADGRMIVGAGSTYTVGTTGGSNTATFSGTLGSAGAHNPTNSASGDSSPAGDSSLNNSAGSHDHTFSGAVATTVDVFKTFKLIKASAGNAKMPTNSILFGTTSLTGLTNVETATNRFLLAGTTYGTTGGSATPSSASVTTSSNGSHKHGNNFDGGDGSNLPRLNLSAGTHNHAVSINVTLNTQRAILSAWTNASAEYDLKANGIALWESATPPTGWFICNGANGTLDLRNYFLFIGTTATQGTRSGNNTASWAMAQAAFSTTHTHYAGIDPNAPGGGWSHLTYAWSHTHTLSGSQTITQPYYALSFIQFGG